MITKEQLYQRQITLPEFGEIGQQRLQDAKVLVVGCGGLGSVAVVYLAASGIGKLHLVDFDQVSVSNLHRQVFYKVGDIGKAKAEVLSNYIKTITPFSSISFSAIALNKSNVFDLFKDYDIILDCTDSLSVKYLINDACILLDKILVYASLYKFDGYVAAFNVLEADGNRTANLRDAFPEMPKKYIQNCAEAGTLNPIVGLIGLMQANEVIKLVTKIGTPIQNQLLIYNSLENSQFKMTLKPFDACHSERQRRISNLFKTETYTNLACKLQDEALLISAKVLKTQILKARKRLFIISVIENQNISLPFAVDAQIQLSKFNLKDLNIDPSKSYIFVCQYGMSSYEATLRFKATYKKVKVLSLEGGIGKFDFEA